MYIPLVSDTEIILILFVIEVLLCVVCRLMVKVGIHLGQFRSPIVVVHPATMIKDYHKLSEILVVVFPLVEGSVERIFDGWNAEAVSDGEIVPKSGDTLVVVLLELIFCECHNDVCLMVLLGSYWF